MATSGDNSRTALIGELNGLAADHFALWVKTKNFHWHVTGPRFRDLHLLFDEQAIELRDQIDDIAERVRKNGADTLTSLSAAMAQTAIEGEDRTDLEPDAMITQLRDDNRRIVDRLKRMKELAEEAGDNATDGLIDEWTDQAEERVWFLDSFLR
jgi:starvation-inducible DNA-binding protein